MLALYLSSLKPLREQWQHITQRFHDGNAPPKKDDDRPDSSASIKSEETKIWPQNIPQSDNTLALSVALLYCENLLDWWPD
jgi:hypothetical protein